MSETYRTLPDGQKTTGSGLPASSKGITWPVRYLERTITSAQILALDTTPLVLVPAQAGIAYVVRAFSISYHHGGTDYTTNLDMVLSVNSVTLSLITNALSGSADKVAQGDIKNAIAKINDDLVLTEGGGDPAAGDGTVDIYVEYLEIPAP
jgi:hypothetical protein